MKITTRTLLACVLFALPAIFFSTLLYAQIGIGNWVRQTGPATPGEITLTVEACCNGGRRLNYHIKIGNLTQVMMVESPFNGTEVPVMLDGKRTGETMAIKQLDNRHWTCDLKMDGKAFGTSRGEISADGKTLTVENSITFAAAGQSVGVQKEVWIKK